MLTVLSEKRGIDHTMGVPAEVQRNAGHVPRAIGTIELSTKFEAGQSRIETFRTSGSSKIAFPRRTDAVEAILLNTSGGLTGGDQFETRAHAGLNSRLVLTTQAAERGYRSLAGSASVRTQLSVAAGATLHWLPQEFIMFDGADIRRELTVDLIPGANAVLVEPIVFAICYPQSCLDQPLPGRFFLTLGRHEFPYSVKRVEITGSF